MLKSMLNEIKNGVLTVDQQQITDVLLSHGELDVLLDAELDLVCGGRHGGGGGGNTIAEIVNISIGDIISTGGKTSITINVVGIGDVTSSQRGNGHHH
jgi:hypothetical protein